MGGDDPVLTRRLVARMERSVIRGQPVPDYAEFIIGPARGRTRWLHPVYGLSSIDSSNLPAFFSNRCPTRISYRPSSDSLWSKMTPPGPPSTWRLTGDTTWP